MDTYEKKYKESLERAGEIVRNKDASSVWKDWLRNIFPELKESEDERIRKDIIKWFEEFPDEIWRGHYKKDIIAWLEKQDSQILANSCETCKDEQKPADKIEPKFKVGDWIVSDVAHEDYRICKILSDNNGEYIIESIYGYRGHNSFETFDKDYRLWSIEDAKDGDVLACENGWTCIFKCLNDNLFSSHCFMDAEGWFCEDGGQAHTLDNRICGEIYPATKEQRDLLFQKIKEAGYEWDENKKELKKISQRMVSAEAKEAMYDKPAWSEEDEKEYKYVLKFVDNTLNNCGNKKDYERYKRCYDWLKSLRERIERR